MTDNIKKTKQFLHDIFEQSQSDYYQRFPESKQYRIEHSYRVAHIGQTIALEEGMDQEAMIIACLLHDVSYCDDFKNDDDWRNHGRAAAQIARPFLDGLNLSKTSVEDICYGIAIHVDDEADFPGYKNAFALSVGDADNIDRYDVYRVYENLQVLGFDQLTLNAKKETVEQMIKKLNERSNMQLATPTATRLWLAKIAFQREFFEKLYQQLLNSETI